MNSTTMYEDMNTHMSKNIDNGGFTNTLQANAKSANLLIAPEAQMNSGEFEDPEMSLIEPAGPIISSTSGLGSGSTDVNSYVEACRCDGAQSFTCSTDTLDPKADLFICIKSVSSDAEVDFLDSMVSILWGLVFSIFVFVSVSLFYRLPLPFFCSS